MFETHVMLFPQRSESHATDFAVALILRHELLTDDAKHVHLLNYR